MNARQAAIVVMLDELAATFGFIMPDAAKKAYVRRLSQLTESQLQKAANVILDTWKPSAMNPYPAICDILAAIGGTSEDVARLAVAQVRNAVRDIGAYQSVSFCERAINYTIRAFGGWVAICGWGDKEWTYNGGKFYETVKSALSLGVNEPTHLSGLHELSESGMGIFDIHVIGKSGARKKIACEYRVPANVYAWLTNAQAVAGWVANKTPELKPWLAVDDNAVGSHSRMLRFDERKRGVESIGEIFKRRVI